MRSSRLLAAFDFFGMPVNFNIRGKQNFKTVVGFAFTTILVASIMLVFFWYFYLFYYKSDIQITSREDVQSTFPSIDLKDKQLFFSLYATQAGKPLKLSNLEDLFSFETINYTYGYDTKDYTVEPTIQATEIKLGPCTTGGKLPLVNGKPISGKTSLAISDNAYCSLFDKSERMIIEGNDDSETYSFIEITVNPCKSKVKTCIFYYSVASSTDVTRIDEYIANNPQLDPVEKAKFDTGVASASTRASEFLVFIEKQVRKKIEDMTITLSYIEGAIDVYDYEDPYNLIMTQRIKVHPTLDYQKRIHVYFRIVETQTDKGQFQENFTI